MLRALPTSIRLPNGQMQSVLWGLPEKSVQHETLMVGHPLEHYRAVDVSVVGVRITEETPYRATLTAVFPDGSRRQRSVEGVAQRIYLNNIRPEYSIVYQIKESVHAGTVSSTTIAGSSSSSNSYSSNHNSFQQQRKDGGGNSRNSFYDNMNNNGNNQRRSQTKAKERMFSDEEETQQKQQLLLASSSSSSASATTSRASIRPFVASMAIMLIACLLAPTISC